MKLLLRSCVSLFIISNVCLASAWFSERWGGVSPYPVWHHGLEAAGGQDGRIHFMRTWYEEAPIGVVDAMV